jgi:hypothetical protein
VRFRHLRPVTLIGALSLLALGGPTAAASAEVEASRITSPAGPIFTLSDATLAPAQQVIAVSGTTVGSGSISLRCYYGTGAQEYLPIENKVTPVDNAFSLGVETALLYGGFVAEHALREGPCVMRAVPYEDTKAHPPGSAAEEAADQFQGPHIANSRFETYSDDSIGDDYEFEANSLSSEFEIQSVGDCGLYRSNLFAPDSLAKSTRLFECDAALYEENASPSGQSTRSELLIDGANAYSPATAAYVEKALATTIPGAPQISATQSFDKATGLLTIHEIDRIVRCSPEASFPPTAKSCTGFVPTGVQLERIWQTDDANHVALMTDNWSSLDGYPHTLDALYHQELVDAGKSGGADELPGSSAFSETTRGQLATLPAGPGAIYHKVDGETATAGDGEHPQGAIVYDPAPSAPLAVFEGSGEGSYDGFEMPYQGTIPASGPYAVRMAFIQAYALPEVEALAKATISSYPPAPTATPPLTGPLLPAPGLTVTAPTSPVAHASQVGSTRASGGKVSFTVACSGPTGSSCEIQSTLHTVEHLRNGRAFAVSARRRRRQSHARRVAVGSSKLEVRAGRRARVTIELNAVGKRLLAQFGHLPVHLSVVLDSGGHRSTIIAENVTLELASHRHRRRRRIL